jgi:hypothetical protein
MAVEWNTVPPVPNSDGIGVVQYIRVGGGSVAVGEGGGPTGLAGYIWLRGPGDGIWRPPMQVTLPDGDVSIVAVIQDPEQLDRIIVVGRTFEGLRERLVIWTGLVDWAP